MKKNLFKIFIILAALIPLYALDSAGILDAVPLTSPKKGIITQDVPFTAQAPTAKWNDPRQQDACEEASSLMAVKWARGEKIKDRPVAEKEILDIVSHEKNNYGIWHDTSAYDTSRLVINGYYKYDKVEVKEIIAAAEIIAELEKGGIIIVPLNGRKLGNPNFTRPGPERHMVLIKGYDYDKKEFITNDPGTRKGNGYRYKEKVLFDAIRDYPSGDHELIKSKKKNMIVVSRQAAGFWKKS